MLARYLLVAALFAALHPGALAAAAPKAAEWDRTLARVVDALKEGRYDAALRKVESLHTDLIAHLGPGERAEQVLGLVQLYRAVASEGVGRHEQALWHWSTALALYPALVGSDLSSFGPPGDALEGRDPPAPCRELPTAEGEPAEDEPAEDVETPLVDARIEPPRKLHTPEPAYPAGARYFAVEGTLIVQTTMDVEGRLSDPIVEAPLSAPSLTLAALDALREWKFAPARVDGEPVCVCYRLAVNYRIRR